MIKTPGQEAFERHCARTGGVSVKDGTPIGSWEEQTEEQQEQWSAGALNFAVKREITKEVLSENISPREDV